MTALAHSFVLVVDDDPSIRMMLGEILADEGYAVVSAAHGADALAKLDQGQPSLIFLDVQMPVMDGPAFVEAYRKTPPPHAPILCMTAARHAPQRCHDLGADDYLGKPFELDHLLGLVERHAGPPPL